MCIFYTKNLRRRFSVRYRHSFMKEDILTPAENNRRRRIFTAHE